MLAESLVRVWCIVQVVVFIIDPILVVFRKTFGLIPIALNDIGKACPKVGVSMQEQLTDSDLVTTTDVIGEGLDEAAVYSDLPDLELIDKVDRASEYLNRRDGQTAP